MEYRVVVGQLGAFYVEGLDPKDTASMSPFNTKYDQQTPIMQFTGLKDFKDVEIYEGDILQDSGKRYEVIWTYGSPGFELLERLPDGKKLFGLSVHDLMNAEVIGNIYENPELLN